MRKLCTIDEEEREKERNSDCLSNANYNPKKSYMIFDAWSIEIIKKKQRKAER